MSKTAGYFLAFLVAFAFVAATGQTTLAAMTSAETLNIPETGTVVVGDDDDQPDVTARVARISFIRGEAKVRRNGNKDWEKATLNLPVVEGDEIATDNDSRIEIQFDTYQHARLAENSFLKIAALKDGGIALSLSLGTMNLRITSFDKSKAYFEIDAPKTTLAVQKAGTFRIDAGRDGDSVVRMATMDGGEGRVYSDNAGFTLKNNRSARIYIDGSNAGEWETADASRFLDEFDSWAGDRDNVIEKRLRDAYYDKYYDRDIYGADDLDDYGQWVNTRDYGYVWRPYDRVIGVYSDWSPYRYGHWRWIPPYGWTWINDEPWGWATYHHGRWIYDDGYWCWTPYSYYRPHRSWWSPALVVINIYSNNVCWYPLGYHHRYHNYNWGGGGYGGGPNNGPPRTGGIKPIPPRTRKLGDIGPDETTGTTKTPVKDKLPPGAVIGVGLDDFGTTKTFKKQPPNVATAVLSKNVDDVETPKLPVYADAEKRTRRDIGTDEPRTEPIAVRTKVGAGERKNDMPMDEDLRKTRVFAGRNPQSTQTDDAGGTGGVRPGLGGSVEPRRTGAVDRQPVIRQAPPTTDDQPPTRQPPIYTPREKVRTGGGDTTDDTNRDQPPTQQPPRVPKYEPPTRQPAPTDDPPPTRQPPRQPRYDPPSRQQAPTDEPPPTRQPPRQQPPPRNDPPPTRQPPRESPPPKSEPKPTQGSSKSADDGR